MVILKEYLKGKLSAKDVEKVPRAFDQVGSIAVFSEFPKLSKAKEKIIGDAVIALNKPIETVVKKTSDHEGKYRTKKVKVIAGKNSKITEHKEYGVRVRLDIEKCYFSPRLGSERLRIAQQVKKGEKVLVLFSGIGIYPLVIAKNASPAKVVGVEWNPVAHKFGLENIRLNKVSNIKLIKSDVAKFRSKEKFDRIVMMLPGGSEKYLKHIPNLIKPGGIVHFYDFQHEGEFDLAKDEVKKVFPKAKIIAITKAGMYSPRKWRLCVDFKL